MENLTRKILPLMLGMMIVGKLALASPFDEIEHYVRPSPSTVQRLHFSDQEEVLDFAVSPVGPEVFILLKDADARFKVLFWEIEQPDNPKTWLIPSEITPQFITTHPVQRRFFLSGVKEAYNVILRVEFYQENWNATQIYRITQPIHHLIIGPRPFTTHWWSESREFFQEYRLFFGAKNPDGSYAIKSVTENGLREYQILGPASGYIALPDVDEQPAEMFVPYALPLGFHPAGNILLWQDEKSCFHYVQYEGWNWKDTKPLWSDTRCGGTLSVTSNGIGLLHWQPESSGVTFYFNRATSSNHQAQEFLFLSPPVSVADGKGIVGLTKTEAGVSLVYVPVEVPLADVINAWMFVESEQDMALFSTHSGLFRELDHDQLYALYETENYYPQYPNYPSRPYFVTTDIFWELFAAAYEGMFIIQEKYQAIPAFWEFIKAANQYYQNTLPDSPWTDVFATLEAFYSGKPDDRQEISRELSHITNASGYEESPILKRDVDFRELKPRGHCGIEPELEKYFKGFKYLTQLVAKNEDWLPELAPLPPDFRAKALTWIRSYENFISLPRFPLVWQDTPFTPPPYHKHSQEKLQIFPPSWGFDNEVLLSTVYHPRWPVAEQIIGPMGPRLFPSALDIAAALGSQFAMNLLVEEFEKYPPLKAVIQGLQTRFTHQGAKQEAHGSYYDQWIQALAVQWADDVTSPNDVMDLELWKTKRLQTGLASWTTLRHATLLVNERGAAEAGEGGFEAIVMQPPRGYVEPDPQTFEAIARLFDLAVQNVSEHFLLPTDDIAIRETSSEPLRQGILRRLSASADKARLFRDIAEKELRGEPLTSAEYEAILEVGRVAEHHFLMYKSLANYRNDYALATPDPMPKIVDVTSVVDPVPPNRTLGYLLSAVGRPLEWDQFVPYFGRRAIVKGAVYSYYEFASEQLLNDQEWRDLLVTQERPAWITPFMSKSSLSDWPESYVHIGGKPRE